MEPVRRITKRLDVRAELREDEIRLGDQKVQKKEEDAENDEHKDDSHERHGGNDPDLGKTLDVDA